jgi:hypothetical protein
MPNRRGKPWRLRAQRRGGYVQAPIEGVSTRGADWLVAYEVETHCPEPEGLASSV